MDAKQTTPCSKRLPPKHAARAPEITARIASRFGNLDVSRNRNGVSVAAQCLVRGVPAASFLPQNGSRLQPLDPA